MKKKHKRKTKKIPDEITEILQPFEKSDQGFEEYEIAAAIRKYVLKNTTIPESKMFFFNAEHIAFNFVSRTRYIPDDWEKYFESHKIDIYGNLIESEAVNIEVTSDIIEYWQKRCKVSRHPILRARYADLIWFFSKNLISNKSRANFARIAIDAYLEIFNGNFYKGYFEALNRLKRAMHLALSINDTKLIKIVRNGFFKLHNMMIDVTTRGAWGMLFDNILINKKIPLTKKQEQEIIDSLEYFLYQTTDFRKKKKFAGFSASVAVSRLVKYYHNKNKIKEVHRVIKRYGSAMEKFAKIAAPLLAMHYLQIVYELYKQEGLNKDAKRVQLTLKSVGRNANKNMKKIIVKVPFNKKEFNKCLSVMTRGGLNKTLIRLIFKFIPRISDAQAELKKLGQISPFLLRIRRIKLADDQIVSKIETIEEDLDGHVLEQIAENIGINNLNLASVIEMIKKRYKLDAKKILKFIYVAPIFELNHRSLIEQGLRYYLNNDYIGAIHIIIPQIEHALRYLLGALGQPTNKQGRFPGTWQEKNLNDILYDPVIKKFLPQDLLIYYKTYLSDPRSYNLRNRVCHGLLKPSEFTRFHGDRIFHILLTLSLIRKK